MTKFVVERAKAPHPVCAGRMVPKGTTIVLQPEVFPAHAALAVRLRRAGWSETSDAVVVEAKPLPLPTPEPAGPTVYPHQTAVIERLRSARFRPTE